MATTSERASSGGGRRGPRPRLTVYVEQGCSSCEHALDVAERVLQEVPRIDVKIVDLSVSSEARPETVFATPTFLLDGDMVSLGTPNWGRLKPLLLAALGAGGQQ